MSFRVASRSASLLLAGVLAGASTSPAVAQAIDPAVVGERIQRLTAAVESLELALASQKRQIESLGEAVQKMREDQLEKRAERPWTDDIRRLADAIAEVDRKRVADSEQVVKVLSELRKTIAASPPAAAERSSPRSSRRDREKDEAVPEKAVPYVVQPGDSLSRIVSTFNTQARQEGYRTLTVDDVMKFNNITDARRLYVGSTLQLPLYPK